MKKLLLVRHAKSDWSVSLDDFERTLTSRGVDDANLVATESRDLISSDIALFSSSAIRARETGRIFAASYGFPFEKVALNDALYTFGENRFELQIRSLPNAHDTCMVFGHNEGITEFANTFGSIEIDNIPTAGLVQIEFDTHDWSRISNGKTTKIIFPRDLRS